MLPCDGLKWTMELLLMHEWRRITPQCRVETDLLIISQEGLRRTNIRIDVVYFIIVLDCIDYYIVPRVLFSLSFYVAVLKLLLLEMIDIWLSLPHVVASCTATE